MLAESVLLDGIADLVGMTRALIADPDLPNKAREGRMDEIRVPGGQSEMHREHASEHADEVHREPSRRAEADPRLEDLPGSASPRKVVVIGAGIAGMEAARVAALLGHDVVVYEREAVAGGQVNLARLLPDRADLHLIVGWYETQLRARGVRVRFGEDISSQEAADRVVSKERPDAVIVATGSSPIRDGMQGFNYSTVPGHERAVRIDEVLGGVETAADVIILDDSAFVGGLALADLLSAKGRRVELDVPGTPPPG